MTPYVDCEVAKIDHKHIILYQNKRYGDKIFKVILDFDGNVVFRELLYDKISQDFWYDDYGNYTGDICPKHLHEDILNNIKSLKKTNFDHNELCLSQIFDDNKLSDENELKKITNIVNDLNLKKKPRKDDKNIFEIIHMDILCHKSVHEGIIDDDYDFYGYECVFNNSKLSVINNELYIISDLNTNEIKNVLYAPDNSLREGEDTEVFLLNNKHIFIYNNGDVRSALFIKND